MPLLAASRTMKSHILAGLLSSLAVVRGFGSFKLAGGSEAPPPRTTYSGGTQQTFVCDWDYSNIGGSLDLKPLMDRGLGRGTNSFGTTYGGTLNQGCHSVCARNHDGYTSDWSWCYTGSSKAKWCWCIEGEKFIDDDTYIQQHSEKYDDCASFYASEDCHEADCKQCQTTEWQHSGRTFPMFFRCSATCVANGVGICDVDDLTNLDCCGLLDC